MIYNISDEPNYGFKRKVEVNSININMGDVFNKSVVLSLLVKYYAPDGNTQITFIPVKDVNLIADTTTWVDVDGNIVEQGSIDAAMTEYDFFMAMMNIPVVISDIVEAKVTWADSLGRFD
jgi:hypothetical protein